MHPNPRRVAPILLIVLLGAAAWWYFSSRQAEARNGSMQASGTIEATQVTIASEIGGHVLEVLVKEGESVSAGQVLVRLDDVLMQAQLAQAQAALGQAQASYELVAAGVPLEQRQAAIAAAELELTNAQQALDNLYDTAQLTAAQVLQEIAAIDKARDKAQQYLDNLYAGSNQVDIDAAWAQVVMAQDKLEDALEDFEPYENKAEDNLTRAVFQAKLSDAQLRYDNLVERYNNLAGTANQYEFALAEADVALAEARLADARRRYEEVKDGPDPDDLAKAQRRLAQAEATLALARAEPSREQLALAQAQVDNAAAAVRVIEAQIEKLVISAASDGVVLGRAVEPGEVILTGAPLVTLAQLNDLTITVYVPEDRYGEITLGQTARVTVDSFPGQSFEASVVRIADEAEYTPRNVQTDEGRRTTVYAIELSLANPTGKLKPGMPADVDFSQ